MEYKKGDIYGTHRVIEPKGVLPQPAEKIDNTMEIYDNEVLIDVQTLNIDSASFTEISRRAEGNIEEIKKFKAFGGKGNYILKAEFFNEKRQTSEFIEIVFK